MDIGFKDPPFIWIKRISENNYVKEILKKGAKMSWLTIFPDEIIEKQSPYGS